jgi:hypothetical protein
METYKKVLISIGAFVLLAGGSFLVYRNYRRKKEDDLTINIGTIDWAKREIPFTINVNGELFSKGSTVWRKDLVAKGERESASTGKDTIYETNLPNGFIIRGESLGKQKFAKIIDFTSKTVKDYNGSNVSKDISEASKTLANIF